MKILCVLALAFVLVCSENLEKELLEYEEKLFRIVQNVNTNETWKKAWNRNVEIFGDEALDPIPFECVVDSSPGNPANVHELRPTDIDVVASFGDSVLAGNGLGASVIFEVVSQNRGEAFTVGGGEVEAGESLEDGVMTTATLLKKFNPNLKGWSWGDGFSFERNAALNVAVPGARATHLPGQADDMIEKMQLDTDSFENDWKLVALFIGGNDLCRYCRDTVGQAPEVYMGHIRDALDKLHAEVPKVMVNLITMFDVTPLPGMSTGWLCDILHENFCNCALLPEWEERMKAAQQGYHTQLELLVNSGRYDTRDDFTVVLQPQMTNLKPPLADDGEFDKTYFSPDCFHPGRKGHQGMNYALWNTMFIPVGSKPLDYPEEETPTYSCPTPENPYIFTNLNSGTRKGKPQPVAYRNMLERGMDWITRAKSNAMAGLYKADNHTPSFALTIAMATIMSTVFIGAFVFSAVMVYKRRKQTAERVLEGVANPVYQN